LVKAELDRRIAEGIRSSNVTKEAELLAEWLKNNHAKLPQMTAKTILNRFRRELRDHVNAESIVVHRTEPGEPIRVKVNGRLAALIGAPAFPEGSMSGVKMVAGERYLRSPTDFRRVLVCVA
jgi:hypothetical protein